MRIFITGSDGQLGKALQLRLADHDLGLGDLPDWNITDSQQVAETLRAFNPDVVIHAAALTNVDYCAEHPDEAVQINGVGTYNVALACSTVDALCVTISTNEVFDGKAEQPYQEYDHRHPANPYGYSKYVAEQVIERFASRYMIARTSWLYAPGGVNFIHKIIARAKEGAALRVVTDEVGCPTYVTDLADALSKLIDANRPGIYHMTNAGYCSRYEFAQEILKLAGLSVEIEPITSDAFTRASTPPPFAPLANVFGAAAGVELRSWQAALAAYINDHVAKGQA